TLYLNLHSNDTLTQARNYIQRKHFLAGCSDMYNYVSNLYAQQYFPDCSLLFLQYLVRRTPLNFRAYIISLSGKSPADKRNPNYLLDPDSIHWICLIRSIRPFLTSYSGQW